MSLLRRVVPTLLPLVALALAGACSGGAVGDAGPISDGGVVLPPRQLVFVGATGVQTLAPGARLPFVVLYTENDGSPIAGATISFALVGSAHDSTLLTTTAGTGADGRASGTLVAGATNATFDVRAAADRATPAHLDVAVSSGGFGAVHVMVSYAGARAFASRTAGVVARAGCDAALAAPSLDREVSIGGTASTATLPSLPAGETYAVVARGLGLDGHVVAAGCTAGIAVAPDATTEAAVHLADLPPYVAGPYDVALTLSVETSALALASTVEGAAAHRIGSAGDGAFYLDAVQIHLRTLGRASAADAIASARASGTLDDDLAAALGADGASAAARGLAATLAAGTRGLVVGGVLTAPPSGALPPTALAVTDVLTSGFTDLSTAPVRLAVVSGTTAGPPTATLDAMTSLTTGALEIHRLLLTLPLGSTARALLVARRSLAGGTTTADLLMPAAGCAQLVSWGASTAPVSSSCDAACLRLSCAEAVGGVAMAIDTALDALDSTRSALALVGSVGVVDANDDGLADSLGPATVAGTWGTGSIVDGDLVAARLEAFRE